MKVQAINFSNYQNRTEQNVAFKSHAIGKIKAQCRCGRLCKEGLECVAETISGKAQQDKILSHLYTGIPFVELKDGECRVLIPDLSNNSKLDELNPFEPTDIEEALRLAESGELKDVQTINLPESISDEQGCPIEDVSQTFKIIMGENKEV